MESSEVALVQGVWQQVKPKKVHHGVEVLVKLFDKYPETKDRFPRLDVSSPEAMRGNVRMQAHAGRVVSQLGALIEDLDNMSLVNETIYLLGENHNKRKVQAKDFEKFNTVFIEYLKETLGGAFAADAEAALSKFMGIFASKMAENLDQ
ncbi:myoglobin-like isoform X2 [Amphibalanus amphitrite]|nr:myoglobin-like isoform X2 [Amphibalanus amphitrite]